MTNTNLSEKVRLLERLHVAALMLAESIEEGDCCAYKPCNAYGKDELKDLNKILDKLESMGGDPRIVRAKSQERKAD